MYGFAQHLTMFAADRSIQQTTANADQIREVEERIQSLCGILRHPVDDQDSEEKARREILRKFVSSLSGTSGRSLIASVFAGSWLGSSQSSNHFPNKMGF